MSYNSYHKRSKSCKKCGKEFTARYSSAYCSIICKKEYELENNKDLDKLSSGTTGAISELLAAADLMFRGWEVFRALSPASHCDLLATKNGVFLRLEVRTGKYMLNSENHLHFAKGNMGSKSIIVVTLTDNKVHYIDFEP